MTRLVDQSAATIRRMYQQNVIYSTAGQTGRCGSFETTGHRGNLIAMRSATPPPLEQYQQWLQANAPRGAKVTAQKLRRAVIMLRQGSSHKEVATAVGMCSHIIIKWVRKLPEGMAA